MEVLMAHSLLPQKLRLLRNKLQLRQEDIARQLHMERTTYCNYENGTRTPSLETLVDLADFFQVPIDYLIRENNEQDLDCSLYPLASTEKSMVLFFRELPPSAQKEWLHYLCYRLSLTKATHE